MVKLEAVNIDEDGFKYEGTATAWKDISSNERMMQVSLTYIDEHNTDRTFTAPAEITFRKESWKFIYLNGREVQYDWKISSFKWLE